MKSLHEVVVDSVGGHLYKMGFPKVDGLAEALTEAADLISNYTEEGIRCYPEIVLTTDLAGLLQPITVKQVLPIAESGLSNLNLRAVLKLCAPHCSNGWLIYIEIRPLENKANYGLLNAELAETAIPARVALLEGGTNLPLLYLSRRSSSVVRLESPDQPPLHINLGLQKPVTDEDYSGQLATEITIGFPPEAKPSAKTFITKLLSEAFREGHGNLIAVVEDSQEAISAAISALKSDGKVLTFPIDLGDPLLRAISPEPASNGEANMLLTSRKSVVKSMLSQDGITVFTTKGRVIAFNVFVKNPTTATAVIGGARTRAFMAMQEIGIFEACLFKSQDGNEKFWRKQ
jgi:hypothetical protein